MAHAPPNAASSTAKFERLIRERGHEHYTLRLYVTGMGPRSTEAVAIVKALCDELLGGRYDLEVVDIYQDPVRASEDQIIAAPTLVKESPAPVKRLIGNLTNRERVRHGLGVPEPEAGAA